MLLFEKIFILFPTFFAFFFLDYSIMNHAKIQGTIWIKAIPNKSKWICIQTYTILLLHIQMYKITFTFAENPYEDCFEPNWGRYQLQDSDEVRCFMVNEDKWTWYGARKDCRERSGDLVTIDTFKDWVIVQSAVTGKFKPNSTYWFGLVQQTWVWSTGRIGIDTILLFWFLGNVIKFSYFPSFTVALHYTWIMGDILECMLCDQIDLYCYNILHFLCCRMITEMIFIVTLNCIIHFYA